MGEIFKPTDAPVVWGSPIQRVISSYGHNLVYYDKCIWNTLKISVNNFVIISNDDQDEPYFIGRILSMYEDTDRNDDQYRADIEMYASPQVALKYLKDDNQLSKYEVIRDLRPFATDISIETIVNKCQVEMCNNPNISLKQLKKCINHTKNMYICRYKLIKNVLSNRYEIVPISVLSESECNRRNRNNEYQKQYSNRTNNSKYNVRTMDGTPLRTLRSIKEDESCIPNTKEDTPKPLLRVTRNNSHCSTAKNNSTNKLVTPIKIITNTNDRIKKQQASIPDDGDIKKFVYSLIDKHDYNNNDTIVIDDDDDDDPVIISDCVLTNEKNNSSINNRKSLKVKRNLNFGLENQNSMMDIENEEVQNINNHNRYNESNDKKNADNLNIKIKIIDKGNKTCKYSIASNNNDVVVAATTATDENTPNHRSKRKILDDLEDTRNENEFSPRKSPKKHNIIDEDLTAIYNNDQTPRTSKLLQTPPQGRKSILKTPSTHIYDTPKSSMIINDTVDTPNRRRSVNFKKNNQIHSYIQPIVTEEETNYSLEHDNDHENDDDHHRGSGDIDSNSETEEYIKRVKKNRLKSINLKITNNKSLSASKLMKSENFTPILKKRIETINTPASLNRSDLELAREKLHVSTVPKSLPCRADEYQNIKSFIESKIVDGCGGCMYISGVPGTGKTATVTEVIRSLEHKSKCKKLPPFKYISINGMLMTEPRQTYVQIYKQLTGKSVSWALAQTLLEKYFTTKSSKSKQIPIVLLVDELDILCNRRQDVIYNLLDWPTKRSAHLIVLTIANTMDLPERLLIGKVTSRLGLTRLTFQPYTHKQLQEVVAARLIGTNSFKNEAIQLVARKVASVSGDCRRALDICRRATEIAENCFKREDNDKKGGSPLIVTIEHIQIALTQMIASSKVQAIKSCSKLEQLFLQSVCAEISRTGVEETNLLSVYNQFETITSIMGVRTPNPDQSLQIASRLGSQRLLICENSQNGIFQKIILNISADDVHYALKI